MSESKIEKCVDGGIMYGGVVYLTPGLTIFSYMGSSILSNKGNGVIFSEGSKLMLSTPTGEILEIGYVKI